MKKLIPFLIFFSIASNLYANPIVNNAIKELGRGEIGANNKGKYIRLYNKEKEAAWCAGFVSYILEKADIKTFKYTMIARHFWNRKDLRVTDPRPGDIICFWRGSPNGWQGHVGIIEKVNKDLIQTIEGNVGTYPAKVKRFTYRRNNIPQLLGYVRP